MGCSEGVLGLPEMLFSSSRVTLEHEASGVALDFTAADALKGWVSEALPPLQVKVAKEWQMARQHEIKAQKAVQLEYDWTFTTPYTGSIVTSERASQPIGPGDIGHYTAHPTPACTSTADANTASNAAAVSGDVSAAATATAEGANEGEGAMTEGGSTQGAPTLPQWEDTTEQIDRALLMERDPILFFDEVCAMA